MKNVRTFLILTVLALLGVALIYTNYTSGRQSFSDSVDGICKFYEKKIGSFTKNNDLKFASSDHYRNKYYAKFSNIYSDEYGLEKDIACYYKQDNQGVTVYFREGVAEKSVLSNQKYFAFWIATSAATANEYKVHWKLTD